MNKKNGDIEKLSNEDLLEIMQKAPLVSIDLIIQSKTGRILLGFRKNTPAKDSWFVPGGIIKKGETLEQAFQRISRKELKHDFSWKNAEFLGLPSRHYYPNEEKFGKKVDIHYVVLPYVVRVTKEFHLEEDDQHWKYKWFKQDELLKDNLVHQNTKDFFSERLNIPNDSGIYRALMAHYIHYDRQFWSRTQILLAVQGAVLIGGYNLRSFWLGPTVMFLGFLITLIVWRLIFRDIKNSRINQNRMDQLANKIFDYYGTKWSPISLRSDPPTKWLAGRMLIHYVVIAILIINVGLGFLYINKLNLFPPSADSSKDKVQNVMKEISDKQKGLEVKFIEMGKTLQMIIDHQTQIEKAIKAQTPNKANASDAKSRAAD